MCIFSKEINLFLQFVSVLITIGVLFFKNDYITEKVEKYPGGRWFNLGCIIFGMFVPALIAVLKKTVIDSDSAMNTPKHIKCRRDLQVGYGITAFFGIVPLVLVLVVRNNPVILSACSINIASGWTLLYFVVQHVANYTYDETKDTILFKSKVIFANFVVLAIISGLNWLISNRDHAMLVFVVYAYYFVFYSTNLAEFCTINKFGIVLQQPEDTERPLTNYDYRAHMQARATQRRAQLKNDQIDEEAQVGLAKLPESNRSLLPAQPSAPPVDPHDLEAQITIPEAENSPSHAPCLECNVCTMAYSNQKMPRLLIGCGHTVCQGCAVNLMEYQKIICPFCRKSTSVPDGMAAMLPKNFAILELIERKE